MKRVPLLFALALVTACPAPATLPTPPATAPAATRPVVSRRDALRTDLEWLAAPERAGRGARAPGGAAAADYIADSFARAGLEVIRQPVRGAKNGNVIGVLGGDEQAVVVGAHYDHLGVDAGGVYPGADDNASGTVVLLDLARTLGREHPKHTVVFVAFGAEEIGTLGSWAYVAHPVVPLARTLLMVNFDMVGRDFLESLDGGAPRTLGVVGLPPDGPLADQVTRAAEDAGVGLARVPPYIIASLGYATDETVFRDAGVPALWFTTGLEPDYHRHSDTADKIKYDQVVATRVVAESLLRAVAY